MGKTLLIISGGIEAIPGIKLAKAMGLHVVVSDINPKAPGFALADDCIIASTYDADETVAAAEKYDSSVRRIDGVICIAADVPLTVASVAFELGLTGIPVQSAIFSRKQDGHERMLLRCRHSCAMVQRIRIGRAPQRDRSKKRLSSGHKTHR